MVVFLQTWKRISSRINQLTYLIDDVLKKMDRLVQNIFPMILLKTSETRRLAEIRDMLLPRLVSGELDVSIIDL